MQTLISKEMTFDCAHMLSGHSGKCANLHGHTYKVQVLLKDEPIQRVGDTSNEMVMDFADLKQMMTEVIMDSFDHAVIFSGVEYRNKAEMDLFTWAIKNGMRLVELPCRTTAESMAQYIAQSIKQKYEEAGVTNENMPAAIGVRLWETPTSCVEVFI